MTQQQLRSSLSVVVLFVGLLGAAWAFAQNPSPGTPAAPGNGQYNPPSASGPSNAQRQLRQRQQRQADRAAAQDRNLDRNRLQQRRREHQPSPPPRTETPADAATVQSVVPE